MKRFVILAFLILSYGAHAALVVDGDLSAGSFTQNGDNSLTYAMRDTGWQAKAYWDVQAQAMTLIAGWSGVGDNWSVGQVNTVTSETGNQLVFSFEWTPTGSSTAARTLEYQLIGWKKAGTPAGGTFFDGMNYDGNYVNTLNGTVERVELVTGTVGGTSGGSMAQHAVLGPVTETVTVNLGAYGTGYSDVSDYDYIGFRFCIPGIGSGDASAIGSTIDNVSIITDHSSVPQPLVSHDTGYTIMKVRSAQRGTNDFIVAASYEGTLLGMDYDGAMCWTNELSGFMVHDVWCEDISGDGDDEVLVANADGHLYCLDGITGADLWQFDPGQAQLTPMYAVCVIKASGGIPYVVCGGFDKNAYYLDAAGQWIKTLDSTTYSLEKPWGDDNWVGYGHTINFLRPIPQTNGTDHLAMNGIMNHMQSSGRLYRFEPLADTPYDHDSLGLKTCGELKVVDPDGDGIYDEFLAGSSGLTDQYMMRMYPDSDTRTNLYLTNLGTTGYRVNQPEVISDEGDTVYFNLCGTHIKLVSMSLSVLETLSGTYAYNDMWKDTQGRILLASAQSGGSCIHILDPSQSGWKTAFSNLNPPGKIQTIISNINDAWTHVNSFIKPAWERDPHTVYVPGSGHSVAQDIEANYDAPVFMGGWWNYGHNETTNWRYQAESYISNDVYRTRMDTRNDYDYTRQQVLNSILPAYNGETALDFWGGHGNDPNYYSPGTLEAVMDYAHANGKKTIMAWPETESHDDNFKWVLDHIMYPRAEYAATNNTWLVFKNKNIFWSAASYLPLWHRMLSGEFADVFCSSMEETTDKTQDLSVAGRMGLWAAGSMNQWGCRTSRDNPAFDRSRQHSYQRLPNHFLRTTIYNLACGATYAGLTYVEEDHFSILWPLIAKGVLFIPTRDEIVSFNPVHLSMHEPDERYVDEGGNVKWTVFYDETTENSNPMVFSHMNGSWPGAELTEWDFSRYASGLKDRRQNFIPPYPNGLVLITPPQQGAFADPAAPRGAMKDHLHPMYKSILEEFITDGRDYISSDGGTRHEANTYYTTVSNAIAAAAQKLPVTVSGDVGWVCAQTSPTHLRLTLVDGGYLNPKDQSAAVSFNTVTPVAVTDILDGTSYSVTGNSAEIDVPLGLFRFIDIALAEPFFPRNGWGEFSSDHGLSGNSQADFDQDGETDFYEYGFGGDPTNPAVQAARPSLQYGIDDTVSFFNLALNHTNPGITYVAEWTDDLPNGPWNDAWDSLTGAASTVPGYDKVERQVYGGTNDHLYFKVKLLGL